jgi:hypothetical protein
MLKKTLLFFGNVGLEIGTRCMECGRGNSDPNRLEKSKPVLMAP